METPEQRLPGQPIPDPWEACLTLGNEWNYKPTNEEYKSGTELIKMLVTTRAKGGNLLLNVGPHPDGYIPVGQEARLRELALWLFVKWTNVGFYPSFSWLSSICQAAFRDRFNVDSAISNVKT